MSSRNLIRFLLPPAILALALGAVVYLFMTKPQPERRKPPPAKTLVEGMRLKRTDYQVFIPTQGTVRPRTESTLIPQVSGRIEWISPSFREGGFFEKGELLLKIEESDYKTARTVAESTLAQARLRLAEEEARSDQALKDWEKLGDGGEPNSLVLRKPQLAEARAVVASANARVEQARRNLERTRITGPYAGRILEKRVDVGQFVTPGTVLARIYAVDYAEIRLPITNRDLAFVDLPELYRGDFASSDAAGPPALLNAEFGGREFAWDGNVVRTEGSVDIQSRQLFVVAQVDDPYGHADAIRPPLKVGMFVQAKIKGRLLKDVFVIPRSSVREGNEVLLIDRENKIRRRNLSIVWDDEENIIVREGLEEGEVLCLTPVTFAVDGAPVIPTILGETLPQTELAMGKGSNGKRGNKIKKEGGKAPGKGPGEKTETQNRFVAPAPPFLAAPPASEPEKVSNR